MAMGNEPLERLIAGSLEARLPAVVERDVRVALAPRQADVLIGMRRSGKTYVMFQELRRLLAAGVPRNRLLYLNLEDDRLGDPDLDLLDRALEVFYRRSPAAREEGAWLFLDEIHVVSGWERFIRRVLDTEDARVVLTGSSAKLMSTEVHTSLRGRSLAREVLPFGLREVARWRDLEPGESWPVGPRRASRLAALADEYLAVGGFPDALDLDPIDRIQKLQDYVEIVLLRDVVERHGVANFTALRHLARALFAANANGFSISSFHGALKSQGIKVGKATLLEYLGHLTDAYLVFLVPIHTRSEKQRLVNPRKVYAIDPGLANAMQVGGAGNLGARLENAVYLELRRRLGRLATDRVTYYRTGSGREVDFLVDPASPGGPVELLQACASLEKPKTRDRELGALEEAMGETGIAAGTVVTLAERETVALKTGTARLIPFWEWSLAPRM